MRQYSILICDDDPDIRLALKRTLRDFRVDEVADPAAALQTLKSGKYAALVSDFSLGADSDGLELLQQVKLLHPDLIRIMVTGTRDLDVAVRAVNEGAVHRFFLKPWDEFKLVSALELLLHSRQALVETEAVEGLG
jgi:DNA-binding NtrC family response regulator